MMQLIRAIIRKVVGDYSAYYIYTKAINSPPSDNLQLLPHLTIRAVDHTTIADSRDPLIQSQAEYGGSGAHAYACFSGDRIIAVCFYWFGVRYLQRNFWPLSADEAKLVQIVSLPEMRGRGIASALIAWSFRDIAQKGFRQTYARIWHSNVPSIRAFERAGWSRIALVLEFSPLRRGDPIRMQFNSKLLGCSKVWAIS